MVRIVQGIEFLGESQTEVWIRAEHIVTVEKGDSRHPGETFFRLTLINGRIVELISPSPEKMQALGLMGEDGNPIC